MKIDDKNKKDDAIVKGCLALFFTPFVLAVLGFWGYSVYLLGSVQDEGNWVPTEALVIMTDIEPLRYEYKYSGKTYTSKQLSSDTGLDDSALHRKILDELKKALIIEVYVNPSKPSEAVVTRGIKKSMYFIFLMALLWGGMVSIFILPILGIIKGPKDVKKYGFSVGIGIVFIMILYFAFSAQGEAFDVKIITSQ